MLKHELTGEQRFKPKTGFFGKMNFVLEVEVRITGEEYREQGTGIWNVAPPRLEWREARIEDFCLPGNAVLNSGSQSAIQGWTALPDELIKFLMGCGEIEGKTFGERHSVIPGNFWWRNEIKKYIADESILNQVSVSK